MAQLTFDKKVSTEFFNAVQTILNLHSSVQNERDILLDRVKMLENERQDNIQKKCNYSPSDDVMAAELNENQRKRIKTEPFKQPGLMRSVHDVSNDDLNAAFHEDDIVGPSQSQPPPHTSMHKSKKVSTPKRDKKDSNEQNKENKDGIKNRMKLSPKTFEKSPTVLSKHSNRTDIKSSSTLNEATWHSKTSVKNATPRRLFDNWSTKKDPVPPQQPKLNSNTRKKLSLSLNPNPPRLKQSTISFTKKCDEEETFCEGVSIGIDEMQLETSANVSSMEEPTAPGTSNESECLPDNLDSVIVQNQSNEVIMIEESESTEDLFQYVLDIKREIASDEASSNVPEKSPTALAPPLRKASSTFEVNKYGIDCEDCKQYHRMIGRDIEKNPPRKYGVCSKHRRNEPYTNTPPGFWNPKISDSESDHEETPFDPRYAKNIMQ